MVEGGQVKPVVEKVLPLAQAAEAHTLMESHRTRGKIVLEVQEAGGAGAGSGQEEEEEGGKGEEAEKEVEEVKGGEGEKEGGETAPGSAAKRARRTR